MYYFMARAREGPVEITHLDFMLEKARYVLTSVVNYIYIVRIVDGGCTFTVKYDPALATRICSLPDYSSKDLENGLKELGKIIDELLGEGR